MRGSGWWYVGAVDPGKSGGFAIYKVFDDTGDWVLVKAGRLKFDNPGELYDEMNCCDEILIERAQSAPGQANQFEYGRAFGRTEAACIMTDATIYYCASSWWKGKLGIPVDKKLAVKKALTLIPGLDKYVKLASDDGVAEAALIGQILLDGKLYDELLVNNDKRVKPKAKKVSYRL